VAARRSERGALWVTQVFFIVWLVKDFAFYRWVRHAYETTAKTGTEALVGAQAVAQERLDPGGYVKVRGELWKARAHPADQPIHQNSEVKVRAASGSSLIVSATE
jgi:membrane-bound ClpP family serine protease